MGLRRTPLNLKRLCLPTTSALLFEGSEEFGTSPIYMQLSGELLLARLQHMGSRMCPHNIGPQIIAKRVPGLNNRQQAANAKTR
jgi:hypothetical protein